MLKFYKTRKTFDVNRKFLDYNPFDLEEKKNKYMMKSFIQFQMLSSKYNRPSRANMQPIPNTIWFAKLKDSPKFIIVKNSSKRILNNYIFSTGFTKVSTIISLPKIKNIYFNISSHKSSFLNTVL